MDGLKDRWTNTMFIGQYFQQVMRCVEGKSEWKKIVYGAKRMPKQKTILNSNSISVLGIPVTFSQHNRKCSICAFHEEIHAFEDCLFVRLSSLVLVYRWTKVEKKFLIVQFQSIYDVRRQRHIDFAPYIKNGATCSAKQIKDFLFGYY